MNKPADNTHPSGPPVLIDLVDEMLDLKHTYCNLFVKSYVSYENKV